MHWLHLWMTGRGTLITTQRVRRWNEVSGNCSSCRATQDTELWDSAVKVRGPSEHTTNEHCHSGPKFHTCRGSSMHALPQLHGKNCDCTSTLSYWGLSKAWNNVSLTPGVTVTCRDLRLMRFKGHHLLSFVGLPEILPGLHRCYSFRSSSLISQTSIAHYYTLNWELRFSLLIFGGGEYQKWIHFRTQW